MNVRLQRRGPGFGTISVVVALLMIAAACGDDSDGTSSAEADTTTTVSDTTTTVSETTTTVSETTTTVAEDEPMELVTLDFGQQFPLPDLLPLYVGIEEGMFEKCGVEVELISMGTTDIIVNALVAGEVDIGVMNPEWGIQARENADAPLVAFLNSSDRPVYSLVVPPEVTSYEDLRGERIAVSSVNAADAYFTTVMFGSNGLAPEDYEMIPVGGSFDRAAALQAGAVSAALIISPLDAIVIAEGFVALDTTATALEAHPWATLWTSEDQMANNRPALSCFVDGYFEGLAWVQAPENREGAVAVLSEYEGADLEVADEQFDIYLDLEIWTADGRIQPEGYESVLRSLATLGTVEGDISPTVDPYVDYSILDAR